MRIEGVVEQDVDPTLVKAPGKSSRSPIGHDAARSPALQWSYRSEPGAGAAPPDEDRFRCSLMTVKARSACR
jgi:hypothetical protein